MIKNKNLPSQPEAKPVRINTSTNLSNHHENESFLTNKFSTMVLQPINKLIQKEEPTTRKAQPRRAVHKPVLMLEMLRIFRANKIEYMQMYNTLKIMQNHGCVKIDFKPFGRNEVLVFSYASKTIKATLYADKAMLLIDKLQDRFKVFNDKTYNNLKEPKKRTW